MVTLRSSDGGSFEVEEAVALQSQTIRRLIEDNCADIPLPNVTNNILAKVLEYCKKHVADIPKGDDGKVEDPELKNWDAEFLNVDQDTLLDLILAANYLNIKHLSNLTCQAVADRKRGNHGTFQNKKRVSTASSSNSELMKQCYQLLNRLMRHKYGWIFNTPVDTVRLGIRDYFTIIKHPIDLGTVKSKIYKGEYTSPLGFCADVRLTFSNAMRYNPPGHEVHTMASELRTIFEERWKAIEKELLPVPLQPDAARDTKAAKSIPPSKMQILMTNLGKLKLTEDLESMTDSEKLKLAEDLVSIRDPPSYLFEFLRKQSTSRTADDDELEIDLENMTGDTFFTLRKLVDDSMQDQLENQRKFVPCITKNMNVPGNGVSSKQPSKGNDSMDEDVDILWE
ncbi:hypothetical protein MKX03_005423 [Papaver bracteatum]|nr:hypothetical protein MKX03_005423 [Papaver bracteatum]